MLLNFVALTIGGNKGVLAWLAGFSFSWVWLSVPKPISVEDKCKSRRVLSSEHEMPILRMCRLMGRCWGNTSLRISCAAENNGNETTHGGREHLFQHSRLRHWLASYLTYLVFCFLIDKMMLMG